MYSVFLESHNIKNPYNGFGQFNIHLINALLNLNDNEIKFTIHAPFKDLVTRSFGNRTKYKLYFGARRYQYGQVRGKYDIWHSLNQNSKIYPRHKMPTVLTVHDVIVNRKILDNHNHPKYISFYEKIKNVDAITYISDYAKEITQSHFDIPESTIQKVISNGNPIIDKVSLENFNPEYKPSRPYFFAIGNFQPRKKFHLLIEMMKHFPNYELIISGNNDNSYGKKTAKEIEKFNLKNQVTLTGKISEKEKQYYLKHSEAFLMPSSNEGFGLPVIEAMSFGKPIFLSDQTSLPEIGGEYSFYWTNYEPQYMASIIRKGIDQIATKPDFYKSWYIKRSQEFTWEKAAHNYLAVYKEVLQSNL